VAIKLLPAELTGDPQFRDRFAREARAMAALDHPNVCRVLESGEHDSRPYLVMQYLDGETLAKRLEKGALPFEQVLRHAIEIADALTAMHRGGITHGSLRPGNIMLTRTGATLVDGGLAKLRGRPAPLSMADMTQLGEIPAGRTRAMPLGDIHYLAPEQVEGREPDARTDIWACGAIVHEMATGLKPFAGETAAIVLGVGPGQGAIVGAAARPAQSRARAADVHGEGPGGSLADRSACTRRCWGLRTSCRALGEGVSRLGRPHHLAGRCSSSPWRWLLPRCSCGSR
jgi:serine/threonine protein kinase